MDLNDGGRIIEICFKDCVIDTIDNFRVSDAIDEISVGVGGGDESWTLDPHNPMKMRENPKNVFPGLWVLSHPNNMC